MKPTTYNVEADELSLARAVAAVARELTVKGDRMGIELRSPALMVEGDGEGPDHPLPPGWKRILADAELGWEWPYAVGSRSSERPCGERREPVR